MTKDEANFRIILTIDSCKNCGYLTDSTMEGWDRCTLIGHEMTWEIKGKRVCDYHKVKVPLTEREKIIKKLTKREIEILGVKL